MHKKHLLAASVILILPVWAVAQLTRTATEAPIPASNLPLSAAAHLSAPTSPFRASILIYHNIRPERTSTTSHGHGDFDITPEIFEQQIRYLIDSGYHIISFSDILKHYENGTPLPADSVVLTFDDGWRSQYDHAYPILKTYGVPATFFIYPDMVGVGHGFMTWDNIKQLQEDGMEIESHTLSHPRLIKISDPVKLRNEIYDSKHVLEQKLGVPIRILAYPFGEYDDRVIQEVRNADYQLARGIYYGKTHSENTRYKLNGIQVPGDLEHFIRLMNKK